MKNVSRIKIALLVTASLALVAIAVFLRYPPQMLYYDTSTRQFSAESITNDMPFPNKVLREFFINSFSVFAPRYLTPVYLLVFPAVILLFLAFTQIFKKKADLFSFLKKNRNEKIFLFIIFFISFTGMIAVHFLVLNAYPAVTDEYSYVFQAKLLSQGRLYIEAPPFEDSFQEANIVCRDGKWYSKYTIGWPLLLAAGVIVRLDFIIAPLCSAFSLIFLYLTAKELSGESGGAMALFITILSPFFFLLGGSYFPHNAVGLFEMILLWAILKAGREQRMTYPLAGSVAAAFILLIRPADGALICAGIMPLVIYEIVNSQSKKKSIFNFFIIFSGFAAGVAILLWTNAIQTGNPLVFAFQKYNIKDAWGFGTLGHNTFRGLWNVSYALMRNCFWIFPFMTVLSLIPVWLKNVRVTLLLLIPLCFMVFYLFFYSLGGFELGSRYYYPAFLVSVVTASAGFTFLTEKITKKEEASSFSFTTAFIIITFLFTLFGVFFSIIPNVKNQYADGVGPMKWLINTPGINERAIIFLDSDFRILNRNEPDYKNQKNVLALYLTPEENKKLLNAFPDRKPFFFTNDPSGRGYVLTPHFDNSESAANYLIATDNYLYALEDVEKAKKTIFRAMELAPNDPSVLMKLINVLVAAEDYKAVINACIKLINMENPQKNHYLSEVIYVMGRAHGELGNMKEAVEIFKFYVKNFPTSPLTERAREWMRRYE